MKYSFRSDYCELAHPEIINAFINAGNKQFDGYGLDEYSLRAAGLIKAKIEAPGADVHFISGGTHANLCVISAMLRPHEAVIAPQTGHIFVHEAGAIEATGHKICTAEGVNGKITPDEIKQIVKTHDDEHMVSPKLVYISNSTETGTIYSIAELTEISRVCVENDLLLFMDGARLGAALNSSHNNLTYSDIAKLTDAFYIGGTKNGALFGEAIVIINEELKKDFRIILKQRGALLSKGAAIGVQFEALFTGNLYDKCAAHANKMAMKLADGITKAGFKLMYPAVTNIIFPVLPNEAIEKLRKSYEFYDWSVHEESNHTAIRLVTSWATPESEVDRFIADLHQ